MNTCIPDCVAVGHLFAWYVMQAYLLIEWCASRPLFTLGVDPGRPSHKILLFESSHRCVFEPHRHGAA